ncbi:MAG: ketoacyl-ACP synthase III [Phycisphaerales bacterium]|nr:ketoacyl-ACP synthase III [Phycisphaerales bacterium]MBT7170698.1 ketoacyl-ACP synthase III [Phycisphaerales bacterium]
MSALPSNSPAFASVRDVMSFFPEGRLTNEDISAQFPDWTADKIYEKTGFRSRNIAASDETASDLAYGAAVKLLAAHPGLADQIDLLVFCTQSPDYVLPTSACVLQDRLGLATTCAAFDFNLGCSGYVYGLSIVKSMIESGQATKALFLTGETYSKWMGPTARSVMTIFGDAGTATLVEACQAEAQKIGPFVYGTDGRGKNDLIVHGSATRPLDSDAQSDSLPPEGNLPDRLYMDGPEIFSFTIRSVPKAVQALLTKSEMTYDDLDWVIFHQANKFMLDHLRRQCHIPEEKFVFAMENYGNTVSNTIPVVLVDMLAAGTLQRGQKLMLVGFGVGYSWSACILEW